MSISAINRCKAAASLDRLTVQMHAFAVLPCGSQEYTDNPDDVAGWSTHCRIATPDDPQQPFDIVLDQDHATEQIATTYAKELASAFYGDPEQYEPY